MIETIAIALFMAVIYALLGIFKSPTEEVKPTKAAATIVLGLIIGSIMYLSGMPITQIGVAEQLAIYAGLLCTIENAIKGIKRRI